MCGDSVYRADAVYTYGVVSGHRVYQNEIIRGVPLTGELLERNGWVKKAELWVLKSAPRLGWRDDGRFVLGWTDLPRPVHYVHELQAVLRLCGLKDLRI